MFKDLLDRTILNESIIQSHPRKLIVKFMRKQRPPKWCSMFFKTFNELSCSSSDRVIKKCYCRIEERGKENPTKNAELRLWECYLYKAVKWISIVTYIVTQEPRGLARHLRALLSHVPHVFVNVTNLIKAKRLYRSRRSLDDGIISWIDRIDINWESTLW